jgi:uncharacterized protein (UPF0261 family)
MVGTGGKAMENLIRSGKISAVLDITTTELADLYDNGVFSAGKSRLSAAIDAGIPQVIALGCLDMTNLGKYDDIKNDARFFGRTLHKCNENVTVMRTRINEYQLIARHIIEQVQRAKAPTVILIPTKGLSLFDHTNNHNFKWYDPFANQFLFAEIKRLAKINCPHIPIHEINHHINDSEFAEIATRFMINAIEENSRNKVVQNYRVVTNNRAPTFFIPESNSTISSLKLFKTDTINISANMRSSGNLPQANPARHTRSLSR